LKKLYPVLQRRENLDFGKAVLQNLLRLDDPALIHQSDMGLCEDGFSVIIYTPTGRPDEWLTATFMLGLGATENEWDQERFPFERALSGVRGDVFGGVGPPSRNGVTYWTGVSAKDCHSRKSIPRR
jgi:hypothetical protein